MKIEIGESLALSYLKHVKKCVFYQNNWKISSKWAKSDEEENKNKDDKTVEGKIFKEIKEVFKDIFKSDTLKQTLKQAEIDALGIDKEGKVYAADVCLRRKFPRRPSSRYHRYCRSLSYRLVFYDGTPYQNIVVGLCHQILHTDGNSVLDFCRSAWQTRCIQRDMGTSARLQNRDADDTGSTSRYFGHTAIYVVA
jgi:hypothetical protein